MCFREFRGAPHFGDARLGFAEPDVLEDRGVEQVGVLGHPGDELPPQVGGDVAERRTPRPAGAFHEDGAFRGFDEAEQQRQQELFPTRWDR